VVLVKSVQAKTDFYRITASFKAAEQLWVTTRTYLREELEGKLLQLFYMLEAFSEKNKVHFSLRCVLG